ncbi:hypothetical protein GH714_015191 [Hevea brasiliensis]|uniref:Wall-associated receptor kinase galacturonan-binding domain-containing protein n=1 Tax=Hevea brasiliensis TaxID=3981 RepID=A0A6A6LYU0_HEVBR|nr:hypothetical protein GH714_015191 [Hevea brasiliensis]
MVALLSYSRYAIAVRRCGDCGRTLVPYPLSIAPDCGDQRYKIRCTAGTLWFDSLNGSSYMITSINPLMRLIIIRPASLDSKTCTSSDFRSQGIQLSDNLPFNISGSNTILLLNCTDAMLHLQPPMDCSATSICHDYIKDSAPTCVSAPLCCTFKTGGFQSTRKIKVHGGWCAAYQSFVNLDVKKLAPKKWPESGVEIEWALPQEPVCKIPLDCRDWLYSKCLPDTINLGQKREEEDVNLVVYTKKIMDEDRLIDVVDPFIKDNGSKLELEMMKALGSLAAACLDDKRQNRPSMKEVADEIEYIIGITAGTGSKS